jgi:para-aminobenzoate synthetase / 4-amino-4-deoxychorismate lyase
MLWDGKKGYVLLKFHLQRLEESAEYFNFNYNRSEILKVLTDTPKSFVKGTDYRVRLLIGKGGNLDINSAILDCNTSNMIGISDKKTDPSDKWFYHKTTMRGLYDSEYKRCKEAGFFDVIFRNKKNQITEGAISNIFIKKNGIYYTPPIECGVLNGVYRRHLLSGSRFKIIEKVIYYKDLVEAEGIVMTNAVRGMVKVKLCSDNKNHHISARKDYAYA